MQNNNDEWIVTLIEWAAKNDIPDLYWTEECQTEDTLELVKGYWTGFPRDKARLCSLNTLNLRDITLSELPQEIGYLTNLTVIALNGTGITSIPKEIGNLVNLTHLHVSSNNLVELPEEIGKLTKLISLDCSYNKLRTLPASIGDLANLLYLRVDSNQLKELPNAICNLKHLKQFNCAYNELTAMPEDISNLMYIGYILYPDGYHTLIPKDIDDLSDKIKSGFTIFNKHTIIIDAPLMKGYMTHKTYTIGEQPIISFEKIIEIDDTEDIMSDEEECYYREKSAEADKELLLSIADDLESSIIREEVESW